MTQKQEYRWPTKLRKFGIEQPFLKIIATKYENEIPWQIKVRNTADLKHHVENEMLSKFMDRVAFPHDEASKNHFYISSNDVSLDAALAAEANRNDSDIETIEIIRMLDGDEIAAGELAKLINERKYRAFKSWIDLLEQEYPNEPEFRLLLLRPLFELSGRGIRCTVVEPSMDVIEWLHRRIEQARLLPNENIATQYCLKLGMGLQKTPSDGWQYIPAGIQNAAQLASASRGSGWCIAGQNYATAYLQSCDFYLLHSDNKPVVALRVSADDQIIQECQGRSNTMPVDWLADIEVFLKTQCGALAGFYSVQTSSEQEFNSKSKAWWRERSKLWPFAILLAPITIKVGLIDELRVVAFQYANFKNFDVLSQRLGLKVDEDFWRLLVEAHPSRYVNCPLEVQALPSIQEACVSAWVSWIDDDQITLKAIKNVPEFVRINARFQEALAGNFLTSLRDTTRKFPNTLSERGNRFKMQDALPAVPCESAELVRERMINILLTNDDEIFSDDKFVNIIRQHDDFLLIREQAWLAAIKTQPPLWFALPVDLRNKPDFQPTEKTPGSVDLEKWCLKVIEKPWLLTQQNGVPKSIRQHRRILEAYREGWLPHLRKSPWRLWVSLNPRRVYMSNGLLADERTLGALTEGWKSARHFIGDYWLSKASERMRNLPLMQISVLQAISPAHLTGGYPGETLKVCLDIKARHKRLSYKKLPETLFDKKIRTLLESRGVM